jgi:uncharacterized repeat protein (TIGR01451 family)
MKMKLYFHTLLLCLNCLFINAQSWFPLNGPDGTDVRFSMMTSLGEIYSITATNEVYISSDKGTKWQKLILPNVATKVSIYSVAVESPSRDIYLSLKSALFKINHISKTIELLNNNIDLDKVYITSSGVIFGVNSGKLYISIDDGKNFTQKSFTYLISSITPIEKDLNLIQILSTTYRHELWTMKDDGSLVQKTKSNSFESKIFHHKKSDQIIAFNDTSYISKDKGKSWTIYNINLPNDKLKWAKELNDGSILASGNLHYYTSQDNGLSWNIDLNYIPMNIRPYVGDHFISSNYDLYSNIINNEILVERNGRTREIRVVGEKPGIGALYQKNQTGLYAVTSKGLQLSTDDGKTWKTIRQNSSFYYWPLFFKDGSILSVNDEADQLLISQDQGNTWTARSLPPDFNLRYSNNIYITSDDKILMLDLSTRKQIYVSSDRGMSWVTQSISSSWPYGQTFYLSNKDILYSSAMNGNGKLYYSLDLGINWKEANVFIGSIIDPVLTDLNQLIWSEFGNLDIKYIIFTNDFGITTDTFEVNSEYELFSNDQFGNCFLINFHDLSNCAILNINTKTLVSADFSELYNKTQDLWNLHTGENGFLYAYSDYNSIHKYSHKVNSSFAQLSGNVILDENQNCTKESTEKNGFPYRLAIKDQKNLIYNVTVNNTGSFTTYVPPGNYQMQLPNSNSIWQDCNLPKNFQVNDNDTIVYNDLIIKPLQLCSDIKIQITMGRLRRCFDNNVAHVYIKNYGSKNATNVKVKLFLDEYLDKIVSSVTPSSQQGKILEYSIPELKLNEVFDIRLVFEVSCHAQLNQVHCIKALFDNAEQCNHILPLSDTILSCEKNIGSFDPNDKMAYSNGMPLSNKITSEQEDIEYLIRFQNTGTDTAFKVVIRDQLDKNLDWNSFEVLSSSHPYSFTMDDGGLITFLFKDILLPDSSINVVASNGYIKYSIKQKDNIALGTVIHNEAAIYFDYNEPVWTNKVSLQLVSPSKTKNYSEDILLTIIPNPFSTKASISLPKELEDQEKLIKIFDLHGKEIMQYRSMEKSIELVNDHFRNGVYLIKVFAKNGKTGIAKFVVEK